MGVLTHVGLLENDKIAAGARQQFVDATNFLIGNGTADFLYGILPQELKVPGNSLLSAAFDIQPIEKHQETFPTWHQIFIDTMFEQTAIALDVECGAGLIAPIGDPTVILPELKLRGGIGIPDFVLLMPQLPFTLPELFDIPNIELELPALLIEFAAKVAIPNIPLPPFLPLPPLPTINIPIPPFPIIPKLSIPEVQLFFHIPPIPIPGLQLPLPVLAFLSCAVIVAIPIIIGKLLLDPVGILAAAAEGPIAIISLVAIVVLETLATCLGIELKNVLTFLAGFLVYIEKLVLMLIVVIVGQIVGQGVLVQLVATSIGLV